MMRKKRFVLIRLVNYKSNESLSSLELHLMAFGFFFPPKFFVKIMLRGCFFKRKKTKGDHRVTRLQELNYKKSRFPEILQQKR